MKTGIIKHPMFCADDWGFSPGINEGILALARNNLLYSVSCVANSDYLDYGLDELLSYAKNGLQYNIHFNLTFKRPMNDDVSSLVRDDKNFYSFKKLLVRGLSGKIKEKDIVNEFQTQMDFLRSKNIPITALDGHHHVHLLPFVFNSLRKELKKNKIGKIRLVFDSDHLGTYCLASFIKRFADTSGILFQECGYLRPKNIKDKNIFEKKISKFERLIAHPALYNDFERSHMSDSLQEERIHELQSILRFFHAN